MTKLDIETTLYGARDAMETLHSIFALQKKLFGSPDAPKNLNRTSLPKGKIYNFDRLASPLVNRSPMVRDYSGASISSIRLDGYSTVACLMQGYLWIKASSMYRKLKEYDASKRALVEAEKSLQPLLEKPVSKIFSSLSMISIKDNDQLSVNDADSAWNSYSPKIRNFVADIMYEVTKIILIK